MARRLHLEENCLRCNIYLFGMYANASHLGRELVDDIFLLMGNEKAQNDSRGLLSKFLSSNSQVINL